jgi:UDP-N-acetylglucosamine--N-acetylmuramyl-(pentapeptide) pyrophosphoryl-undecaprenol N-acetylglucosamine transferase
MAKVLIAAGGTGGHIYPALAIADAFKSRPDITVEFVGTAHGLENKLIPAKGYKLHHLPVGRLNSNVALSERIMTVFLLPLAFLKSALLLRREKPSFVLGVGGHASGPLLLMSSLLGYRSAIWEPNAMPGMANRILSRFVDECWVVFDEAKAMLKSRNTHSAGMPVRKEIEESPAGGTSAPKFRILVFGGSQGARGINTTVVEMVKSAGDWLNGVHIVHQTGAADYQRIREAYGGLLSTAPVDLREYLYDMGQQYANSDLVICRSGTGTLSELAACGKASILIPFPFASDDHQKKNAESLVVKGAAGMILQKDLTAESLRRAIDDLRAHPQKLKTMSDKIRDFHHPRAAEALVGQFLERISHAAC